MGELSCEVEPPANICGERLLAPRADGTLTTHCIDEVLCMILRVERKNVCRISVEEAKEAGSDLPGMVFGDAVMLLGEPIISETFGKSNPVREFG